MALIPFLADIPFEQLIGVLVMVIIALSQIFTAARQRKKQQREWQEAKVSSKEYSPNETVLPRVDKPEGIEEQLREFLEALGVPREKRLDMPPAVPPPVVEKSQPPAAKPGHYQKKKKSTFVRTLKKEKIWEEETKDVFDELEFGEQSIDINKEIKKQMQNASKMLRTTEDSQIQEKPSLSTQLGDLLQDRSQVQQAIILSEILGRPKALL